MTSSQPPQPPPGRAAPAAGQHRPRATASPPGYGPARPASAARVRQPPSGPPPGTSSRRPGTASRRPQPRSRARRSLGQRRGGVSFDLKKLTMADYVIAGRHRALPDLRRSSPGSTSASSTSASASTAHDISGFGIDRATSSFAFVLFLLATVWALLPAFYRPRARLPAHAGSPSGSPRWASCSRCSPGSTRCGCELLDLGAARHCSTAIGDRWCSPSSRCCPSCATGRRSRAASANAAQWANRPGPASGHRHGGRSGRRPAPPRRRHRSSRTPRRRRSTPRRAAPPAAGRGSVDPRTPGPRHGAGPGLDPPGDPRLSTAGPTAPRVRCRRPGCRRSPDPARRVRRRIRRAALREWTRGLPARTPAPAGARRRAAHGAARGRPGSPLAARPPSRVAGLAGWRSPSSSSRPSIPPAGCRVGGVARAGRPALAARPGRPSSTLASGPLVLAPLLLTLGDRLGAVPRRPRARARAGRRLRPRRPRGAGGRWSACTSLLDRSCSRSLVDGAGRPRRPARGPSSGAVVLARRRRRLGGRAASPAPLDAALDRLPGADPAAAARRARRPADGPRAVHRGRRRSRWPPTRTGTRPSPARSAAPAPGALGLLGLGVLLLPNAAAAVLGLAAGPGLLRRQRHARLGARRHAGPGAGAAAAGRAARHPGGAAARLRLAGGARRWPGWSPARTVGRWFTDEDGGSVVAGLTGLLAGRAARASLSGAARRGSAAVRWATARSPTVGAPAAGHRHRGRRAERDRRRARRRRRPAGAPPG